MKLGSISPIKKRECYVVHHSIGETSYCPLCEQKMGFNGAKNEYDALEIVFSEEAFMETIKNQLMQEGDLEEKGLSLHQMLEGRARYIISHMDKIISLRRAE